MPEYPECEKLQAVKEKSQIIGEFLEWLSSGEVEQGLPMKRPIFLAGCKVERQDYHSGKVLPRDEWWLSDTDINAYTYSTERLLAEFFGVDLKKVAEEQNAILKGMRERNGD